MKHCSIRIKSFFVKNNDLSWDTSLFMTVKNDNKFILLNEGDVYVIVCHHSDKAGKVKWAISSKHINKFSVVS